MLKRVLLVGALVVAVAAGTVGAATSWFGATLEGAREVGSVGDLEAAGVAFVGFDSGSVSYMIWVRTTIMPQAAHIHMGAAGQNGGIVLDFSPTFTQQGTGAFVAQGTMAADSGTIQSIMSSPMGYYVNVHSPDFPAGAVRGQLLGDGAAAKAFAARLDGGQEIGNPGDPDGTGFAGVVFDGDTAFYVIQVDGITAPTAAHIHSGAAGVNGGILVDFSPGFSNGIAFGSASVPTDVLTDILGHPDGFYVNVHNSDFPAGAVRGQLAATETTLYFPVLAKIDGQVGSKWRTSLRVLNPSGREATVFAEWYPQDEIDLDGPKITKTVPIPAAGVAVYDDAVSTLLGTTGSGALRLLSTGPITAAARVFNDQRGNTTIPEEFRGTNGQFLDGLTRRQAPMSGAMLLGSQTPPSSGEGFRTNLGYFNPSPNQVTVLFNIRGVDGTILGVKELPIPGFASALKSVFSLVRLDMAQSTVDDFIISYSSNGPLFVYSTPVDNVVNDSTYVTPNPVTPLLTAETTGSNSPPVVSIVNPASDLTINVGDSVNFEGSASDPDGDSLTYLWDFGDQITSTALVPGNHTYTTAGVFTVKFTATDPDNASATAMRTVTVQAGGTQATFTRVQNEIFTPSCAFVGCHAGSNPAQGQNLSAGQAYSNIVNVPAGERPSMDRIEPGQPSQSYLWLKVTDDPSIIGARMPRGAPALSQEKLDLLREWIEAGALNN